MRKILKTLALLLFVLFLSGCSKTKEFIITFNTNTDYIIEAITIKKGEKLTLPLIPERDDFVFEGWYRGDEKFDDNTKINEDITLIAHWSVKDKEAETNNKPKEEKDPNPNTNNKKTYKVTFVYYSGVNNVVNTVEENKTVEEPADITRTGYLFSGWYVGDDKYDFNQKVTKDITLTSRWKKNSNLDNLKETNPVTEVDITYSENNFPEISQYGEFKNITFKLNIKKGVEYNSISWNAMGSGGYTFGSDCNSSATSCTITAKNNNIDKYRVANVTVTVENSVGNKIKASKTLGIEGKFKLYPFEGGNFDKPFALQRSDDAYLEIGAKSVETFFHTLVDYNLKVEKVSNKKYNVRCTSMAPLDQPFGLKFKSATGQGQIIQLKCVK